MSRTRELLTSGAVSLAIVSLAASAVGPGSSRALASPDTSERSTGSIAGAEAAAIRSARPWLDICGHVPLACSDHWDAARSEEWCIAR